MLETRARARGRWWTILHDVDLSWDTHGDSSFSSDSVAIIYLLYIEEYDIHVVLEARHALGSIINSSAIGRVSLKRDMSNVVPLLFVDSALRISRSPTQFNMILVERIVIDERYYRICGTEQMLK